MYHFLDFFFVDLPVVFFFEAAAIEIGKTVISYQQVLWILV